MEKLRTMGVNILVNSHGTLPWKDGNVVIGGIPDKVSGRFFLEKPSMEKAFAGALPAACSQPEPQKADSLRILLSHRPFDPADEKEGGTEKADLILSGHTHGGSIFFLKPLIALFNGGFVSGLYDIGKEPGGKLYVSNGTGIWAGFSCRVFVPSEITHIIFE